MVVGEIAFEQFPEVSLTEDYHVIQTLTSNGADHPLHKRILPGATRRADDLLHAQGLDSTPELVAIGRIAVTEQVPLATLFGQGFPYLLTGPFGARMFRDSEMKYFPPLMLQNEKHE